MHCSSGGSLKNGNADDGSRVVLGGAASWAEGGAIGHAVERRMRGYSKSDRSPLLNGSVDYQEPDRVIFDQGHIVLSFRVCEVNAGHVQ